MSSRLVITYSLDKVARLGSSATAMPRQVRSPRWLSPHTSHSTRGARSVAAPPAVVGGAPPVPPGSTPLAVTRPLQGVRPPLVFGRGASAFSRGGDPVAAF